MSTDAIFDTFLVEADELLIEMENLLMGLSEGIQDADTLNALFRAAHTIKGSAGIFNLAGVVGFTHIVENLLDNMRSANIAISENLISTLLRSRDHITTLIARAAEQEEISDAERSEGDSCTNEILSYLKGDNGKMEQSSPIKAFRVSQSGNWHLSIRFGQEVLRDGMDPFSIFTYLNTIGDIKYCGLLLNALPHENFDPTSLYLGYELRFESETTKEDIENAFTFVQEDLELTIIEPNAEAQVFIELIKSSPFNGERLGDILLACSAITQKELDIALKAQDDVNYHNPIQTPLGQVLVTNDVVNSAVVKAAVEKQATQKSNAKSQSIRVDSQRLDGLINLIGELVVNKQRIDLIAQDIGHEGLNEVVTDVGLLTEQIRDATLNLRMTPIGDTFMRFKRIVRDTAKNLGKEIKLKISGEETELDRAMIEKLSDPLTHIVRNSLDHGIEKPEQRIRQGKTPEGNLSLNAYHESGNVVIEIIDDGGGINCEAILKKAIEKGVISASHNLTEKEAQQLIFHPGFSTAAEVTNLSGRGVGMDVVRRNIEDLQGAIEIHSTYTVGTTIKIRLPLTLAIIDGFHTSTAGIHFVVPQNTIVECVDFESVRRIDGHNSIDLRGDMVPYVELNKLFSLAEKPNTQKNLIIVQFGENKAGLLVDHLYGELQTVVKPLSPIFKSIKGIGGSGILGSGDIAFVLDIPQLISFAESSERQTNTKVKETLQ